MFDTIESASIVAAVCAGLLLCGLYFGGLWWTVRRMPLARHPLNLYFGSLIARLAILLAAFYGVLSYAGWAQLVAALVGFIAARLLLIRIIGPARSGDIAQREAV
ncbi:MAG: ATP synthase subunit I [Planctomycetota bacterium]|nr:MAG: ATP synthase subunit I [Planctomycetota bacterium]